MKTQVSVATILAAVWTGLATADWTDARCDIYPQGSDHAANREVEAKLEGDTWIVVIDGKEVYEVPLAAIEGG